MRGMKRCSKLGDVDGDWKSERVEDEEKVPFMREYSLISRLILGMHSSSTSPNRVLF